MYASHQSGDGSMIGCFCCILEPITKPSEVIGILLCSDFLDHVITNSRQSADLADWQAFFFELCQIFVSFFNRQYLKFACIAAMCIFQHKPLCFFVRHPSCRAVIRIRLFKGFSFSLYTHRHFYSIDNSHKLKYLFFTSFILTPFYFTNKTIAILCKSDLPLVKMQTMEYN